MNIQDFLEYTKKLQDKRNEFEKIIEAIPYIEGISVKFYKDIEIANNELDFSNNVEFILYVKKSIEVFIKKEIEKIDTELAMREKVIDKINEDIKEVANIG